MRFKERWLSILVLCCCDVCVLLVCVHSALCASVFLLGFVCFELVFEAPHVNKGFRMLEKRALWENTAFTIKLLQIMLQSVPFLVFQEFARRQLIQWGTPNFSLSVTVNVSRRNELLLVDKRWTIPGIQYKFSIREFVLVFSSFAVARAKLPD